jgi:hypothetical protein
MNMVRSGLHRMQRIRGHDLAVQVDLAEHYRGHRHLIGFHANLGLVLQSRFVTWGQDDPGVSGVGLRCGTATA